jgi:4-alpha-glucanotransferase
MASRPAPAIRSAAFPPALRALARRHGLECAYVDMSGRVVRAAPESLFAILRAQGVPLDRFADCREALRAADAADAARPLPPVSIAWNGRLPRLGCRRPASRLGKSLRLEIQLEHGEILRHELNPSARPRGSAHPGGGRRVDVEIELPVRLPLGYHRIVVQDGSATGHTRVLSAPRRGYTESGPNRSWGFFAPLYALRSHSDWGTGDFTDLARFAEWIGGRGGEVAGTLPLLPLFLGEPFEPSPYSPISRLFWNEFYLDLERIPELAGCPAARRLVAAPGFRRRIAALRAAAQVDYREAMALKRSVLEILARHHFRAITPRHRAFQGFLADHPEVETYAAFRAAQETHGADWSKWPERVRPGPVSANAIDPVRRRYHLYAQWLAHEQMADATGVARRCGVRLYLDLPLGVHPWGYDAWRFRHLFVRDATGGAPPDPVFTRGQDWGFAPLHPEAMREDGYAYLRSCLRHHLGSAGLLRFDHVMSLHRLYWIPAGRPASEGVYVRYPAEEWYAVLGIESHRHRAVIVGENLGTVPPVVNRSLARHGVRGMHVAQYELGDPARQRLPVPPAACVASLNTHDMPPFAAFWRGLDIGDRFALGLLDRSGLVFEHRQRKEVRGTLARQLRRRIAGGARGCGVGSILGALWAQLSAGPAEVVLANLEDVWLETLSQNMPGTSSERRNWRQKCRFALERWDRLPAMQRALAALRRRPDRKTKSSL